MDRESILNCPINRCLQGPPVVCADADVIEAGQVETIGTSSDGTVSMLAIAAEAADGATQRTADVAAGDPPRPDRWTPIFVAEDVTMPKLAADDSIAAGSPLWWSEDDNCLVSALSKVDESGVCFKCAQALEASDDPNDKICVTFDGRFVTGEAGTG